MARPRSRPRSTAGDGKSPEATRRRILEAAERLFLEHGFDGTSLRMLTAAAGVNLAAVNYHFGGKEGLFREMIGARFDPLNRERIALLAEYERAAAGRPLECETLLNALFAPTLRLAREAKRDGARTDFLRLLGRAYVDPSPVLRRFLSERYAPAAARFKEAFARTLPDLPKRELSWRLHFMMGALAYTLAGTDPWKLIAALSPERAPERGAEESDAVLLRRLAPFLAAGLQAPLPAGDGEEHSIAATKTPQRRLRPPGRNGDTARP
ncbi:MAG TPA: TetR family transcriptional regulator [Burkholderiales bacterium]|nr:TetR family transcriptional regulator [Burkholderiales bacterium]